MQNDQPEKDGIKHINQQSQNGGINQNALRDINNNSCTIMQMQTREEEDFGIIGEIFDFIFRKKINDSTISDIQDSGKVLSLREKLNLNFDKTEKKELGVIMVRSWGKIEIVEKYVQENNIISSERIDGLILLIRSLYREKRGCSNSEEKIESIKIIDAITKEFIPTRKTRNSEYYANALAIVLFFFQMCEIGKKTKEEEKNSHNIF